MPTSNFVSVGKPATAGAMFVAPVDTTLPTDAVTALDAAFKGLGYVSEDGLTNSLSIESENIKAWGGDVVMPLQTSVEDTFTFTLIESLNADVLKAVYGSDNVTGTLSTGLSVEVNADDHEQFAWVIDMNLRNGGVRRIVIPSASITSIGEITYRDNEAIGYNLTLTAVTDSTGAYHHEYTKRA